MIGMRMSANTSPDATSSPERSIELKNRGFALFLAWLVPGFGHFYQGRRVKGGIFFCCILGTFFSGVCLGGGKSVHWSWKPEYRTYWYPAQFMAGIVAVPAYVQSMRQNPKNLPDRRNLVLDRNLSGKCEGVLSEARLGDEEGVILNFEGEAELSPSRGAGFDRSTGGKLIGRLIPLPGEESPIKEPTPVELSIIYLQEIDPPLFPSADREFKVEVEGKTTGGAALAIRGKVGGKILNARRFVDRYCAPLDDYGLEQAHGELGKYFELGMMYTMIAGLLNVLAMWDAFEGPAYGYGDDDQESEGQPQPEGS